MQHEDALKLLACNSLDWMARKNRGTVTTVVS